MRTRKFKPTFEISARDEFERAALAENFRFIAGVDEVGRGALAGPVVAAAAILDPTKAPIDGIDDSKQLSARRREILCERIRARAITLESAFVDSAIIDRINIRSASLEAMREAILKLKPTPDLVLVDGRDPIPDLPIEQWLIVKGDRASISIGAASIVAKVERDRWMSQIAKRHPEYLFDRNKGYPTGAHIAALEKHGRSPIHRLSFGPVARLT